MDLYREIEIEKLISDSEFLYRTKVDYASRHLGDELWVPVDFIWEEKPIVVDRNHRLLAWSENHDTVMIFHSDPYFSCSYNFLHNSNGLIRLLLSDDRTPFFRKTSESLDYFYERKGSSQYDESYLEMVEYSSVFGIKSFNDMRSRVFGDELCQIWTTLLSISKTAIHASVLTEVRQRFLINLKTNIHHYPEMDKLYKSIENKIRIIE